MQLSSKKRNCIFSLVWDTVLRTLKGVVRNFPTLKSKFRRRMYPNYHQTQKYRSLLPLPSSLNRAKLFPEICPSYLGTFRDLDVFCLSETHLRALLRMTFSKEFLCPSVPPPFYNVRKSSLANDVSFCPGAGKSSGCNCSHETRKKEVDLNRFFLSFLELFRYQ